MLIGGEVKLADGTIIDSRTPIVDDPWDVVLREVLSRSALWWESAQRLTDLILTEASQEAWALTWCPKTARRVNADGTTRNARLKTLLGDVVMMDAEAHKLFKETLDPATSRHLDATSPNTRYRALVDFHQFPAIVALDAPAVFLAGFHSSYSGMGIVGLSPLDYVSQKWPDAIMVLPHTPLIDSKVEGLLASHRDGYPTSLAAFDQITKVVHSQFGDELQSYLEESERSAHLLDGKPTIAEADLRVTGYIDRGVRRNHKDLDAAREYVETRFDLEIGLWDLARDPVLRKTLAQPGHPDKPSNKPSAAPSRLMVSANNARLEKQAKVAAEKEAREASHRSLWPHLRGLADQDWWTPPDVWTGWVYLLQVGPYYPNRIHEGDVLDRASHRYKTPWMSFQLKILKSDTRLLIEPAVYQFGEKPWQLLESYRNVLERAGIGNALQKKYEVATVHGEGWGGDSYNGARVAEFLTTVFRVFEPAWNELVMLAHQTHNEYWRTSQPIIEMIRRQSAMDLDDR